MRKPSKYQNLSTTNDPDIQDGIWFVGVAIAILLFVNGYPIAAFAIFATVTILTDDVLFIMVAVLLSMPVVYLAGRYRNWRGER